MDESTTQPVRLTEELSELMTRLVKQIPYEHRRQAMGEVVQTLLGGKSRKAEDVLGWNRHTVELGLNEFRTGIRCLSDVSARGKKKVEVDNPQLMQYLQRLVEFADKTGLTIRLVYYPPYHSKYNAIERC